mmetsp:Transcript_26066/g.84122  ORF Transcript_26066/g.84122 Transcript_26066/m.84122 type:complete len:229 (-) Transcript_26066:1219-1905(-)
MPVPVREVKRGKPSRQPLSPTLPYPPFAVPSLSSRPKAPLHSPPTSSPTFPTRRRSSSTVPNLIRPSPPHLDSARPARSTTLTRPTPRLHALELEMGYTPSRPPRVPGTSTPRSSTSSPAFEPLPCIKTTNAPLSDRSASAKCSDASSVGVLPRKSVVDGPVFSPSLSPRTPPLMRPKSKAPRRSPPSLELRMKPPPPRPPPTPPPSVPSSLGPSKNNSRPPSHQDTP